jgi:hypothetical protein
MSRPARRPSDLVLRQWGMPFNCLLSIWLPKELLYWLTCLHACPDWTLRPMSTEIWSFHPCFLLPAICAVKKTVALNEYWTRVNHPLLFHDENAEYLQRWRDLTDPGKGPRPPQPNSFFHLANIFQQFCCYHMRTNIIKQAKWIIFSLIILYVNISIVL